MIVTVTLNAAIDRTLTVPNFQRGQRHRASAGVTLAGGKGINVARALKTLGVPVVATGLVGGTTGTRIVEELTNEAILNDFVHIDGESRTSTAVVDPTGGTYTEINEWGPAVRAEELEMLLEKLRYLTQGAELVVFAGSLPRDVADDFYAEAIRDLNRRGVPFTVVDVQKDEQGMGRMKAITGEESAPVLTLGDKMVVKGFSESRWQAALDEAGYPKAPAQRRNQAVGRVEPAAPPPAPAQGARPVAPVKGGDYPK